MNALTLTPLQQRFADGYSQHGNATRAAIEAGYSEGGASSQGSALLRIPKVRAAIETALKDSAPVITRDVIVRELWKNHLTHQADNPQASNRALELLAKMGGMMIEHSEVQVTVTRDLVEAEIARLEKELAVNDPSHA